MRASGTIGIREMYPSVYSASAGKIGLVEYFFCPQFPLQLDFGDYYRQVNDLPAD